MHLLDICCVRDTNVGILESKINTFLKHMWYSKSKGCKYKNSEKGLCDLSCRKDAKFNLMIRGKALQLKGLWDVSWEG